MTSPAGTSRNLQGTCRQRQQLLLSNLYAAPRFRERVRKAIFSGKATMSRMTFSLEMARAAVVDVTVDDDLNIFTLALLSGRPHVMSCSLLTKGKRRWVHRFQEQNLSGLTCIAAGLNNLVALGDKKGRIHVYEVRGGGSGFIFLVRHNCNHCIGFCNQTTIYREGGYNLF